MDDADLLRRLRQGDEAAFETLVGRHHASLVRVARTFVGDDDAALEVVQDTWLAVLQGLAGFEGRSSLKTWIFAILGNRARTRAVREKRSIPFSRLGGPNDDRAPEIDEARFTADGAWAVPPAQWGADSPEDQVLRREAMDVLQRALAELPPNQQAVVTLRDIEGLSPTDVCNILQVSETNHRVLLHRGRSRLRSVLERHWRTARERDAENAAD